MRRIISVLLCYCMQTAFAASAGSMPLSVMLDWRLNVTHAPLIVAQQQGYFKEEGLSVTFTNPPVHQDAAQAVASHHADIGLAYEPWLIEHIDHGMPVVRIGTLIDKPLNCIVALKRSGIHSLKDLKGKTIGTSSNPLTRTILTRLLEKQGVRQEDIHVVLLQHSMTQALLANQVDAISGTMRNLDVPQLEANGYKLVVFFPEEHGMPTYSELVFITHTDRVKDPRYPKFLAAIKKAVRYLDEHPQEAWNASIKQYPYLNTALNHDYWFATLPYYAEEPTQFDRDEWRHFARFMQQNKLISKARTAADYAITIG